VPTSLPICTGGVGGGALALFEPEVGTAAAAAAAAAAVGDVHVGGLQLQTLQRQIATHTQLLVQVRMRIAPMRPLVPAG
jgi:hypothetical protein